MSVIDTQPLTKAGSFSLDTQQPGAALDLAARAQAVADIAARHAAAVDAEARFPAEGIAAARQYNLFALLVPKELGGEGAPLSAVADVCYTLGQACASTAMIVAMHQAALACVTDHYHQSPWHADLLRRTAKENLLFASSTTEGLNGGNVRNSAAPLVRDGDMVSLDRAATCISYGAQADVIVTTARRDADGAASDQSLVTFLKEDCDLTQTDSWDTFGMRGTCSIGFALRAKGRVEQILPVGYERIHPQSMVPVSHLTWAALWAGIAAAAVTKAQAFIRTAARRSGGQMPPGLPQFTRAAAALRNLRAMVSSGIVRYEAMREDVRLLTAIDTQGSFGLLKVTASEKALETISLAMRATGLPGYRNDTDFSMGRHLRDILSAPIMIHNDRILSNLATTTLMSAVPNSLSD